MSDLSRDDTLRPWLVRSSRLVSDRVADARSHGQAGRHLDATSRLTELRRALSSTDGGLLPEARTSFYRRAFHEESFDPTIHDDVRPNELGEHAARYTKIGGRNQALDLRVAIEAVTSTLRALSDAASADDDGNESFWRTSFDVWQRRTTDTLTATIHGMLSDAQMALYEAVGRVRIKPALR
jgi:hypothetical protein